MNIEGVTLDARQCTVQYELLRSQIIGTVGDAARGNTASHPRGIGLALLLSEGLPGWLKTVEAVLRVSPTPRPANFPDPSPLDSSVGYSVAPGWLPSVKHHEITALWASLVLSTRLPAR